MNTRHILLLSAITAFMACASPEQRASEQTDTNTLKHKDSSQTDTTSVDGRSGDNGTGTDTTNTAEEKAIRESH